MWVLAGVALAGDADSYQSAAACGECHPTHYAQWRTSMHAYAALSPVFDAMAAKAYRDSSGEIGTFCTGCHTPIGTAQGEPGVTEAATRSAISRDGVSCHYCHTAVDHDGVVGNTKILTDPTGPMRGPFGGTSTDGHTSEQSDFVTGAAFCGSCHDVFAFPALQIEEAYTEYLESPSYPGNVRCQDCHMSPEPGAATTRASGPIATGDYPDRSLSDHSFVGPDYSLIDTFPYPDDPAASAKAQAEQLQKIQTLLENAATLEDIYVQPGSSETMVGVTLVSTTNGHRFPTGFTSERQVWVELQVTQDGEVVCASGDLDAHGDLRDAHSEQVLAGEVELDEQLVNLQSENWYRWNPGGGETSEALFPFEADTILRRSLEPGERREVSFACDGLTAGAWQVSLRLRYRNLPPYVLRALQLDDLVERLQIFTIATLEEEGTWSG